MKIKKIIIKNFRSIEEIEMDLGDTNILVGRNNHGKTNLLKALEWFREGKGKEDDIKPKNKENTPEASVEVTFNNDSKYKRTMTFNDNATKKATEKLEQRKDDKWKKITPAALQMELPDFEFIYAKQHLDDITGNNKDSYLKKILGHIIDEASQKDDKKYKELLEKLKEFKKDVISKKEKEIRKSIEESLKEQLPEDANPEIKFEINLGEIKKIYIPDRIQLSIDGLETDIEKKGEGTQRALMVALIKAHADQLNRKKCNSIYFIDEAEIHLHPGTQRRMKESLIKLGKNGIQTFITTHSSVFIGTAKEEDEEIFKIYKEEGVSTICPVEKEGNEITELVYDLLGGTPEDLLFPGNFMFVEGESDKIFLETVIKRFYKDKPNLLIMGLGGNTKADQNVVEFKSMYGKLPSLYHKKLALLLDKHNSDSDERKYKNLYSGNNQCIEKEQFFCLTVESLEEVYPTRLINEKYPEGTNKNFPKNLSSKKKKQLAKYMGEKIREEELRQGEMKIMMNALDYAWGHNI